MGEPRSAWSSLRGGVEALVVLQQLGSALFDTALQMVVKERLGLNASSPDPDRDRDPDPVRAQTAVSDFFMTYNLLAKLTPIVPALLLAKLGDRGWRRAPIVASLLGYVASRAVLLLVVLLRRPVHHLWAGAALQGLGGGFCAAWAAVMTLVSLRCAPRRRAAGMMRVELLYGLAGLLGSLPSGFLFPLGGAALGRGALLAGLSLLLYGLSLLYAVFLLEVQVYVDDSREEITTPLIDNSIKEEGVRRRGNMINIALLFAGAVLFDTAVAGADEILVSFQMKEPLNWNAKQMGYGNASGFLIFLTSFLGVKVMSRWVSDVTLIIIGMLSFTSGIYFMAFVTETYMFYIARALMLFALIPTPTIRSILSQLVTGASYGITLTSLQLSFKFASLAYTPAYTRIYQHTLGWLPGFVFLLSSVITVLATVPISIVGCRRPVRPAYRRIEGS